MSDTAPRGGGVGVFTYRIVYIHINICLLEHSRCQLGTLRMRRDAGARPSYLKYGCRHTLLRASTCELGNVNPNNTLTC